MTVTLHRDIGVEHAAFGRMGELRTTCWSGCLQANKWKRQAKQKTQSQTTYIAAKETWIND
jgi:hypothetical protein